jgi:hypothetical protein
MTSPSSNRPLGKPGESHLEIPARRRSQTACQGQRERRGLRASSDLRSQTVRQIRSARGREDSNPRLLVLEASVFGPFLALESQTDRPCEREWGKSAAEPPGTAMGRATTAGSRGAC